MYKKYGKSRRFSKLSRYIRKTRARYGSRRRIARRRRRLIKNLSLISEKKYTDISTSIRLGAFNPASKIGNGLIYTLFPTLGTATNQRIGTQIFVRYIILKIDIVNSNNDSDVGSIFLFKGRECSPGTAQESNMSTYIDTNGMFVPPLMKTLFNKVKITQFLLDNGPISVGGLNVMGAMSHVKKLRMKFRVMKKVMLHTVAGECTIPDYFVHIGYMGPPYSYRQGNGAIVNSRMTLWFSDA